MISFVRLALPSLVLDLSILAVMAGTAEGFVVMFQVPTILYAPHCRLRDCKVWPPFNFSRRPETGTDVDSSRVLGWGVFFFFFW